ncbi:MAG: molybdopterin molybdotransferase MoeA, partial [Bradymonadaceae bacterium]
MIGIAEALELISSAIEPLPAESTPVTEAVGRVALDDLVAASDVPAFRQSAMDGYGLRSADVAEAEAQSPVSLEIVGEVPAGPIDRLPAVGKGEAVRIFTGAPVPEDVDAVVRQERVRREGDTVIVEDPISAGNDIRPVGESLDRGTTVGEAGVRLSAGTVGRAAMTGIADVEVRSRPRVAVVATGNEVRPAGASLRPGELYDANSPFLAGWLSERRVPFELQHLPDDRDQVAAALDEALERFDLVVTTGGVSVGDHDHVVGTAAEVGLEEVFWKIHQKPGKPVWFGLRDETPLLGLPGNPGAVFVGAQVYL